MNGQVMQDPSVQAAERWAARAFTIAGLLMGALVGLFVSPDLQRDLKPFGVDQVSFRPAAPIILCCAIAGAVLARRYFRSTVYRRLP